MTIKLHKQPASKMKMNRQISSKWLINGTGSNWSQWQLMSRKSSSSKKPHNFQRSIIAECRNRYSSSHGQMASVIVSSTAVQFVSLQECTLTLFISWQVQVGALVLQDWNYLTRLLASTFSYTPRRGKTPRDWRIRVKLCCADPSPRICQHF